MILGYWRYASVEELHQRTLMWLSEITFWHTELLFMQKLVSDHFVLFTDKERIETTLSLTDGLQTLEKELATIKERVLAHEKRLLRFLKLHGKKREEDYRTEHGTLEKTMSAFVHQFRSLKKRVFAEADEVLKAEKLKHLLGPPV